MSKNMVEGEALEVDKVPSRRYFNYPTLVSSFFFISFFLV